MATEIKTPLELNDVSAAPAAAPTGSLYAYSAAGKLTVKNSAGDVVTLAKPFYQTVQDGAGTAVTQRNVLRFTNLTVADDSTAGVTKVTVSAAERAAISFEATDFEDDVLTIAASAVPFAYTTPILQVVNDAGAYVLVGLAVDPTDKTITLTGEPFDGKLLISNI